MVKLMLILMFIFKQLLKFIFFFNDKILIQTLKVFIRIVFPILVKTSNMVCISFFFILVPI